MVNKRNLMSSVVWVVVVLLAISVASAQSLLTVKVTSLDAALGDAQLIAQKAGQDISKEQILAMGLSNFGIEDSSWIDSSKPIVAILPASGMMMGAQGLVGAFPVKDVGAALAALESFFDSREEEEGISRFTSDALTLTVRDENGYLILGALPNLVKGFDLNDALSAGDYPAGSIAAEFALEPILPLIQMGMMQGRMLFDKQMQAEGNAEAMSGMADLYFGAIQDLLNNLSAVQFSIEVRGEDLISHSRLLPKAGSTMEEWVRGQDASIPAAAATVLREDAVFVGAGSIKYTPKMQAAMKYYSGEYVKALDQLLAGLSEEEGVDFTWIDPLMQKGLGLLESAFACGGGDFASGGWVNQERGFSYASLHKVGDREACASVLAGFGDIVNSIVSEPGEGSDEPSFKASASNYSYKGSKAHDFSFDFSGMLKMLDDSDEDSAIIAGFLNDGVFQQITGLYGEWIVSAGGKDAGPTYNDIVDRIDAPSKKMNVADFFAPLGTGNGAYFVFALSRFFDVLPEESIDRETRIMRDLDIRLVYGIEFDGQSLDAQFAFPLSMIEKIAALGKQGEASGNLDE